MLGEKMAVKAGFEAKLAELAKRRGDGDIHSFFTDDGSLKPIGSLDDFQRQALNDWMYSSEVVESVGPVVNDINIELLLKIKEF